MNFSIQKSFSHYISYHASAKINRSNILRSPIYIITTNLYQLCKEKKVDKYYNKYSIGIGSRIYDFNDSE